MARGENVFYRKDGRFEARYVKGRRADGKLVYGFCYGRSYEEAMEKAEMARRKLKKPGESEIKNTISYFCDNWLLMKRTVLKPSSYVKYHGDIKNHIRPYFGTRYPGEIQPEEVDAFTRMLLEEKGLSPKTVRGILVLFHTIFKYIKKRMREEPRPLEIHYPKERRKTARVLEEKEEKALVQVLARNMDLSKFGVYLALRTGMRIGEICALRWGDISMESQIITIRHTAQRLPRETGRPAAGGDGEAMGGKTGVVIGTPKSDSSLRQIPLMPDIAALCVRFLADSPESFVLTGTDKCMDPRKLQRRLKKYLDECQIGEAHFHTLRHTFATRCVEVGVDVKTLSEILGHSNIGITMNQYVHPNLDLKRESLKRLKPVLSM